MIDMELSALKSQNFTAIASHLGYQRIPGETGASHTLKNDTGDKVVAKFNGDHWIYFSVHDRTDNGSVLDFIQRRKGWNLGNVRKWLRDVTGQTRTPDKIENVQSCPVASASPVDAYRKTAAVWAAATWNPAPAYLQSRGLSAAVLASPMFTDCWRVDRHGNVIFPHNDQRGMCGYERRGPDCKSFGKDTRRGVWRSANLWHTLTTEIVICEAPIDCLSHYQLTGGSLAYIATGGSLGSRQLELLRLLFKRVMRSENVWITVGTDNDPAGEAMYEQIAAIAPFKVYRQAAVGKDWSDDLTWLSREAKLKPRQEEAYNAIFDALERGIQRQLVNLPTGIGKTALACHIARQFQRVLFLCHRAELVEQTARTMRAVDPEVDHGRIVPGIHEIGQFTIAMLPTVHRRLGKIDPATFDCVIVDEAHHAASRTWREVLDHFTPRLRIGLTATPERLDGLALSNLFDQIVYEMSLADAVNENYLVPPSAIQCLTSVNISTVRTRGGDLAEDELAALVDDPARNAFIAEKYLEHCPGRRAIAFCVNIAHAKNLVDACVAAGINAEWISGDDPERADKLARFARGEFQLLANCQILTEGFDDKAVDAILLCRPTKSRSLFAQMIGRGLRLNDGKADCRVLDFVDNAGKHCLVTAWRFFGHDVAPANEMPQGICDEKKKRESKIAAIDRERTIDLLKPPVVDTFTYGSRDWHYSPASDKQLGFLSSLGYDVVNNDYTRGQATAIIGSQPASFKQLRKLADCGYDISVEWTRAQADKALGDSVKKMTAMIERIKARGFSIEAAGNAVKVEPFDRLDLIQRGWIDAHRKPLLLALQG